MYQKSSPSPEDLAFQPYQFAHIVPSWVRRGERRAALRAMDLQSAFGEITDKPYRDKNPDDDEADSHAGLARHW